MGKKSRQKWQRRQQPWLPGEKLNPADPAHRTAFVTVAAPAEGSLDDPSLRAHCQRCQAPLRLSQADGERYAAMKQIAAEHLPPLAHVVTTAVLICGRCARKAVKAWADSIEPAAKPRGREWEYSGLPGAQFLEKVLPGEPEEVPEAPRADRSILFVAREGRVLFSGPAADLNAWFGLDSPSPPPPPAEPTGPPSSPPAGEPTMGTSP
jgi:hypothetical protein